MITQEDGGLNGQDGILGLSPANEAQNGPSFMKALVQQGIIDEPIATFWLNYYLTSQNSFVVFGGVPDNASQGDTYSLQLKDDLGLDAWWTVRMKSVRYGEDGEDLITSGQAFTILDSGTSLIYLETADYYNFIDKLQAS